MVRVKAAAVNPVDILNLKGSVRLIQDYKMPLTLGNECSGVVEKIGSKVKRFNLGDKVYSRVPIETLGAFAEFVSIKESALAHMAHGLDYDTAAAIPLTGLTAYEAITEELKAKPGESPLHSWRLRQFRANGCSYFECSSIWKQMGKRSHYSPWSREIHCLYRRKL